MHKVVWNAGLGTLFDITDFGMKLEPQGSSDFKDGIEIWAAFTGERLVKAFSGQSCVAGNPRHTLCTSDITQCLCNECSIPIGFFEASFKVEAAISSGVLRCSATS